MYLSVYLFKNEPTGPHEVDFKIGNGRDYFQNIMNEREGGLLERWAYYKHRLPNRGLLGWRGGGGGLIVKGDLIELLQ